MRISPAWFLIMAVAGCGALPQRLAVAPPLTRSASCSVGGEDVTGRPSSTPTAWITMNNDGGWCWMTSSEMGRGMPYGPFLKMTQAPANGAVDIAVTEKETRVAYQLKAGFVGTDTFQTVSEELNYRVNYTVTVSQ